MATKKSQVVFVGPVCECGSVLKEFELGLTCSHDPVDDTYRCMQCNTQFIMPDGKPITGADLVELEHKVLGNRQSF